jgi:histidinol-phosphate aminotransferase
MNRFWSPSIAALEPYVPGEQPRIPNLVKLNTNESPYGPSPKALQAMAQTASDTLRLYPDPDSTELKQAIAEFHHVTPNCVFVGNGSDEVLAHVFRALLNHDAPLLFPDISYSFYPVYCRLLGIEFEAVPLSPNFDIVLNDYHRANGGIIFPNPNAPTGKLLPVAGIEKLLRVNTESVVVVDEAYIDFGGESAVSLTTRYPNLVVVHTLSKSRGLAGLRVGFAIADAGLIDALERVKNSFNSYPLSRFAQAGASAAMRDTEYFHTTCQRLVDSRERLVIALEKLNFEVLPSAANFILARHPQHRGVDLANQLRERAILVRHFNRPRIEDFLRITIGTDAQCELLANTLAEIVVSGPVEG